MVVSALAVGSAPQFENHRSNQKVILNTTSCSTLVQYSPLV